MKKYLLLALAVSAVPFAASAGELSYSNVEFGYAQNNLQTHTYSAEMDASLQDTRPKGFYARGSIELGQSPFYAFGGYTAGRDSVTAHYGTERYRLNSKGHQFQLGLGYHYGLTDNMNLIAEGSWLNSRYEYNRVKVQKTREGNGMRMGIGLDGMLTDNLEGWGKVNYTFGNKLKGRAGVDLGLQYKFTKTWGVVGQVSLNKDNKDYLVGVRASF